MSSGTSEEDAIASSTGELSGEVVDHPKTLSHKIFLAGVWLFVAVDTSTPRCVNTSCRT